MASVRLTSLRLAAGSIPGAGPRSVDLSPVTVLVGPNNGGKSTALADLLSYANHAGGLPYRPWAGGRVISDVAIAGPADQDEALRFLGSRIHQISGDVVLLRAFSPAAQSMPPAQGTAHLQLSHLDVHYGGAEAVAVRLLQPYTLALNGRQRFDLATGRASGPLDEPPNSHWMAIERDDRIYAEVNEMIQAAFDEHLALQTFRPPTIEPALAQGPMTDNLRHSTAPSAIAQQKAATPLSEMSDGVQVFAGLVAAVAALPHILLLIDEPEAFLHPTLARRLGANLARIARERDARLFAATHSADFLLGCIEQVPETTVLRLDYRQRVATSHALTAGEVATLSKDPLLRSADALRALFARSAVVCEADADRAFYEEINRRLLDADGRQGARDCVFLNAQNWQTTVRLAQPLRSAGVPAAVVLDLETLANDETWPSLIRMGVPDGIERDRIHAMRTAARDAIVACGRPASDAPLRVKLQGMAALNADQRRPVQAALDALSAIGIFLVNVGELERWLPQFRCTNKQTWVTDMFDRLGSASSGTYVAPGAGDVWEFIERVAAWLEDPNRKGLPGNE